MSKVLLVGCGHMGTALVKSWLNLKSHSFTVVDPFNHKKLKNIFKNKKIKILNKAPIQNEIKKFDLIIFAVKPQIADKVISEYKNLEFKKNSIISSIIAGKKINFFKKRLKYAKQFVRIMPNMPALIRNGVSCFVSSNNLSNNNKNKINKLFLTVGKTVWLKNENQIDKATAVSGSGPGYVFALINSFEKAAQKLGFSKNQSRELVITTILGSINLMEHTKKEPYELEKLIAVKGGTTEAGLKNLKNYKIDKIIYKTYMSAYRRAKILGKKN